MAVKSLDVIADHYRKLAPLYNHFYENRFDGVSSSAVKYFGLQPDDGLVDFGAGTGGVTHLIWKKGGLVKPALAVDPCKELLDFASKLEGIDVRHMTCEEFIQREEVSAYNRFFFCQTFHHLPDPEGFLKMFYQRIPVGSKLILVQIVEGILWEDLKKRSRPLTSQPTEQRLSNAGFSVSKHIEKEAGTLNRKEYFEGLRNHMWSALRLFSDEEIEQGIAELDRDYFHGKDSIEIDVSTAFYVATKLK